MTTANNLSPDTVLLAVVAAIPILVLVLFGTFRFFFYFSQELKYLNSEISRASEKERKYWIKQRRRLWLSLIPFVKY